MGAPPMNTLIKTTLSIMALGVVVNTAHATRNPPPPPPPTDICGDCKDNIPIEMEVKKVCELTDVSEKIVLDSNTGAGVGGFKVATNAPYNLLVTTDNQTGPTASSVKNGAHSIATTVNTTGPTGAVSLGVLKANEPATLAGPKNNYSIAIQATGPWGLSKPAGTYTDKYNIVVSF